MALSSQALANVTRDADKLAAQENAKLDVIAQQKRAEAATIRGYKKTFGRAGYKGPWFPSESAIDYQADYTLAIAQDLENRFSMQQIAAEQEKVRQESARVAALQAEEAKKVAAIKQEVTTRTREGAEKSSSRMRARRAGGGLLSAASSPDLSAPAIGPSLGAGNLALGGSGSGLGSTSMLGTRVKI
jgi:hypothetical protein